MFIPSKIADNHTIAIVNTGKISTEKIFTYKAENSFTLILFFMYIKAIRHATKAAGVNIKLNTSAPPQTQNKIKYSNKAIGTKTTYNAIFTILDFTCYSPFNQYACLLNRLFRTHAVVRFNLLLL